MRIDSLSFLPQFILDNPDVKELLEAEQNELDRFTDYVEMMRNQTSISTASIYLERYEKMFGLNVNNALTDQERIGRILAKLNTRTNSTVQAIKTVVSSITGCSTDIEEYYDQYSFMIDVLRDNDQLINIEDIKDAVEIIKPAHLAFTVMMCWKFTIGIHVESLFYKVGYDICSDSGADYDYAGETPNISYYGSLDQLNVGVQADDIRQVYPYRFAGQYPNISTLGGQNEENGQIIVELENYATPFDFAQKDGDFCGED